MNQILVVCFSRLRSLLSQEAGQNLVEYGLVVSMIAFAATASMQTLSSNISSVFTNVGTELTSSTT